MELYADLTERLRRNRSEFRLAEKRLKRNIKKSEELLLKDEQQFRMNSDDDFFYTDNYIKIDNTEIHAEEVARIIIAKFDLDLVEATANKLPQTDA